MLNRETSVQRGLSQPASGDRNPTPENIARLLHKLGDEHFHGVVQVSMRDGAITFIRMEQSVTPETLESLITTASGRNPSNARIDRQQQ
jgi:hypothetical protein